MMQSIAATEVTSDGAAVTGAGLLTGVLLLTDGGGANDAKVLLYDNTAASGKVIFEAMCDASEAQTEKLFSLPNVRFENGVYADLTGTGASVIVYFVPRVGQ